ncbi:MAG: hypothetical protein AAB518_01060 [Patescibacteria group bacterium]
MGGLRMFLARHRILLAALGTLVWFGGLVFYGITDASGIPIILWAIALLLLIASLATFKNQPERSFWLKDIFFLIGLLVVFAPVYTTFVHEIPWQVNTDEVTIMLFSEKIASTPHADPVGLSDYFGFPSLPFFVFGKLANMLGGMSLAHMRLIHAWSGVCIVLAGYCFFRAFLGHGSSLVAAILLGANHSLIAISRMAMRDNTGLLIELLALGALAWGLKRRSLLLTFFGGIFTGLTFYTYYPSRITLVIWVMFLAGTLIFLRDRIPVKTTIKFGVLAFIGFLFTIAPLGIATIEEGGTSMSYPKQQFLFLKEGQDLQVEWSGGIPVKDAIVKNISQGLSTFNEPIHDQGYIYPNYGHGFVDPITGVLIWIGLTLAWLRLVSRADGREGDLLAGIGFLILYLAFSLLITKAPNYTRLLVTLPFVSYLGAIAIRESTAFLTAPIYMFPKIRTYTMRAVTAGALLVIFILNFGIFGDFVAKGYTEGNDVGGTGRYVEMRAHREHYSFYLAANESFPYYSWGNAYQWKDWLGFFADSTQEVTVVDPKEIPGSLKQPPFTVFMSDALWKTLELQFRKNYPNLIVHSITPYGHLRAIEVLEK